MDVCTDLTPFEVLNWPAEWNICASHELPSSRYIRQAGRVRNHDAHLIWPGRSAEPFWRRRSGRAMNSMGMFLKKMPVLCMKHVATSRHGFGTDPHGPAADSLTIKCPLALLLSPQLLSQVALHPPTRHYATSQVYALHPRLYRLRLRCGGERSRRNNYPEGIIPRQPAMRQPMSDPCGLLHWMRVCFQHTGRARIDRCFARRVTNWG